MNVPRWKRSPGDLRPDGPAILFRAALSAVYLLVTLLGAVGLTAASGCVKTFQGVMCDQDSDCPDGQGCDEADNVCRPTCVAADECPSSGYR